ncbi:MAG: hypothetical protein CMM84_15225 [Rhodothermaceae bacterium]|nr:hypothetical protein [Rhodothermaceae bacterium]
MRHSIRLLALVLLVAPGVAGAQVELSRVVVGGGATAASGATFGVQGTIGQSVLGEVSGGAGAICQGFWCGGGPPTGGAVSIVIDTPRGVRFLGPPASGLTVDDLAAQNLVRGVPGYYPAASPANLETTYDPVAGAWVPSSGTGEVLALGRAFRWRFYDHANGNPDISQSVPLPFTLTTDLPANTADVVLDLDTGGNRFTFLANPFGTALDLTGIGDWPGGDNLSPNAPVWVYDPVAQTWDDAPASVSPWVAFRVRAKGPPVSGQPRTLTIPASASVSALRAPVAARTEDVTSPALAVSPAASPRLAFTLDGTAADGRPLADRAFTVVFEEDARAGFDEAEDAEKLQVPADTYAMIGARHAGASGEHAFVGYDVRPFAAAEILLAVETRGAAADLTLRWDAAALPAGLPVTLVDLVTGAEIDVRSRSEVAFQVAPRPSLDEVPLHEIADIESAAERFVLRIGASAASSADEVREVSLSPVVPNPSAGLVRVAFAVPEAGRVRLAVYDVRGREVAVLADGEVAAGRHETLLDGTALAAGVYVVRLEAGGHRLTRQAVVMR